MYINNFIAFSGAMSVCTQTLNELFLTNIYFVCQWFVSRPKARVYCAATSWQLVAPTNRALSGAAAVSMNL
jgi:hypothetical protein